MKEIPLHFLHLSVGTIEAWKKKNMSCIGDIEMQQSNKILDTINTTQVKLECM